MNIWTNMALRNIVLHCPFPLYPYVKLDSRNSWCEHLQSLYSLPNPVCRTAYSSYDNLVVKIKATQSEAWFCWLQLFKFRFYFRLMYKQREWHEHFMSFTTAGRIGFVSCSTQSIWKPAILLRKVYGWANLAVSWGQVDLWARTLACWITHVSSFWAILKALF